MSDTSAIDDDSTMAQLFCGQDTLVCDVYGIKHLQQFVNTLSDNNIHKHGAMETLITEGRKYKKLLIFSIPSSSPIMNLNAFINIRTNLRITMVPSNTTPTPS